MTKELQKLLLFGSLISCLFLATSFYMELVQYVKPCKLCKLQRLPLFVIAALGPLCYFRRLHTMISALMLSALIVGAALALYHLLVLYHVISDPCTLPTQVNTLQDFHALLDAPLPCSIASWKLFKLPISWFGLVFHVAFLMGSTRLHLRTAK